MAMSGMEMMLGSMISKLGIDPEQIKATVVKFQTLAVEVSERQDRIETKLDEILSHVRKSPDGGFVLGDGTRESNIILGVE